MRPPAVVFDTNVLISALAFSGATAELWAMVERDELSLSISPFILREFAGVLINKLDLADSEADLLVDEVLAHARLVDLAVTVKAVKARDADNRILECAVEAKADILVTGDLKHLRPLRSYRGIRIMTPAEFRDLIAKKG